MVEKRDVGGDDRASTERSRMRAPLF